LNNADNCTYPRERFVSGHAAPIDRMPNTVKAPRSKGIHDHDAFDGEPARCPNRALWTTAESEVHESGRLTAEMNLARRHLTDAQKTRIGIAIEPDIAA
jgi:hypothetical protein